MTDKLLEKVIDGIIQQLDYSRTYGLVWIEGGKSKAIAILKSLVETAKDEVVLAHRAPDAISKPGGANLPCGVCGKPASFIIERKALCQECREKQQ